MSRAALLCCTALALVWAGAAHGEKKNLGPEPQYIMGHNEIIEGPTTLVIIVKADEGGYSSKYTDYWHAAAEHGALVKIVGICASACTLVTVHLPKERICFMIHPH
jgi:hypothetical protein